MAQDKSPGSVRPANEDEDGQEAPLPPSVVVLKAAVYLMGIVLVAGFGFLVYTLATRVNQPPAAQLGAMEAAQQVRLAPGATIHSMSLERNLLALHVRQADGRNVIVIHDINRGETVRRIDIVPGE